MAEYLVKTLFFVALLVRRLLFLLQLSSVTKQVPHGTCDNNSQVYLLGSFLVLQVSQHNPLPIQNITFQNHIGIG